MKILTEKKKKKPYDSCTITTGDIDLNIQHFNKCAGTDGGPLTEDTDDRDLDLYCPTEEDFKILSRRFATYIKYGDDLPSDQEVCHPKVIVRVNQHRLKLLIRYWIIAKLLGWTEEWQQSCAPDKIALEPLLKNKIKQKLSEDEVKEILNYVKKNASQLAYWAGLYAVARPKQESLNNSEIKETLTEAKRYVRRYYIRPQNVFCSNKTDVIQALIQFEDQDCSIYTLNNLGDEKDVTKLTNRDIIYYYDDGILYDKNHMRIMDYDLAIKHEEERPNVDIDQTSDTTLSKIYDDRLTGFTDVDEAFNLHFDDINAYGETLCEGKAIGGTCCICGEKIDGYGNNPEPYISAENGERCCDECNSKFVIPARIEQYYKEEKIDED